MEIETRGARAIYIYTYRYMVAVARTNRKARLSEKQIEFVTHPRPGTIEPHPIAITRATVRNFISRETSVIFRSINISTNRVR